MGYTLAKNSAEANAKGRLNVNPRILDASYYFKIDGKPYYVWKKIDIQYNREGFVTSATIVCPRYNNMLIDGSFNNLKKNQKVIDGNLCELIFDEAKLIAVNPTKKMPVVEIYFAGEEMMSGVVSSMDWQLNGYGNEEVVIECSDFMAVLAFNKVTAGFDEKHVSNHTASFLVGELIDAYLKKVYGVTKNIVPTTVQIGKTALSEFRYIPGNMSYLDLISKYANFSGHVFYMTGHVFNFVEARKSNKFRRVEIEYEKHTRNINIRKGWASENLVVEGLTVPTVTEKNHPLGEKVQPVIVRIGRGGFKVHIPDIECKQYGQNRNRDKAREALTLKVSAVYYAMAERILNGNISGLPGRIDLREFDFKVSLLGMGLGLDQIYLPISIKHSLENNGKYTVDLSIVNIPENTSEATLGADTVESN